MSSNFFESLGLASVERIHTQMLYWFFESESVLSVAEKTSILQFINPSVSSYRSFKATTEHKNIDLLIKADDSLYVFENKIKSTEHSNQLDKYKKCIEESGLNEWNGDKKYFIYLTLIAETPTSQDWKNVTYRNIYDSLRQFQRKEPVRFEDYALNEYINVLAKLTSTIDAFLLDHRRFRNVFTDGWKTKLQKLSDIEKGEYSDEQKYIARNQLETILQRNFLSLIARKMPLVSGDVFIVSESRGTALLDIHYKFSEVPISVAHYVLGIQFQGSACKIILYDKDPKAKSGSISKEILNTYRELAKELGFRFNAPRKNAYLSISTPIKKLQEMSIEEAVRCYAEKYKKTRDKIMPIILTRLRSYPQHTG